mmetsp:Transcript_93456/g.140204  ORF Transcript_93456/g.140204 Transcript_93456/m.140204 type:complete len:175 (-) Transcript_93456:16-540(-)
MVSLLKLVYRESECSCALRTIYCNLACSVDQTSFAEFNSSTSPPTYTVHVSAAACSSTYSKCKAEKLGVFPSDPSWEDKVNELGCNASSGAKSPGSCLCDYLDTDKLVASRAYPATDDQIFTSPCAVDPHPSCFNFASTPKCETADTGPASVLPTSLLLAGICAFMLSVLAALQ